MLDSVASPLMRVMHARGLDDFFGWWMAQGRPPFNRATVQAWRTALESKGLAPASFGWKVVQMVHRALFSDRPNQLHKVQADNLQRNAVVVDIGQLRAQLTNRQEEEAAHRREAEQKKS